MAKNTATVKIPSTYPWLPLVSPSNFIKGLKVNVVFILRPGQRKFPEASVLIGSVTISYW